MLLLLLKYKKSQAFWWSLKKKKKKKKTNSAKKQIRCIFALQYVTYSSNKNSIVYAWDNTTFLPSSLSKSEPHVASEEVCGGEFLRRLRVHTSTENQPIWSTTFTERTDLPWIATPYLFLLGLCPWQHFVWDIERNTRLSHGKAFYFSPVPAGFLHVSTMDSISQFVTPHLSFFIFWWFNSPGSTHIHTSLACFAACPLGCGVLSGTHKWSDHDGPTVYPECV